MRAMDRPQRAKRPADDWRNKYNVSKVNDYIYDNKAKDADEMEVDDESNNDEDEHNSPDHVNK
jgi:hypothetical protein